LARHRRPVAALIAAVVLDGRPDAAERLDTEDLLTAGGTVTLAYDPGISGEVSEDGDVTQEPWPALFTATARDHAGAEIGGGAGDSIAEALLRLQRTPDRASYDDQAAYEPHGYCRRERTYGRKMSFDGEKGRKAIKPLLRSCRGLMAI